LAKALPRAVPRNCGKEKCAWHPQSGSTSAWSKSGGTWSIVSDGSQVLQQSDSGSARAREFAGDTGWTDYSVQARVKATSFASTAGLRRDQDVPAVTDRR